MSGESGTLTLREGHAVDLLAECPPLDLIVTDPPYAFGGDHPEHAVSATVAVALRGAAEQLKRGHWMIVFAASSKRSVAYMEEAVRGICQPVRYGTWVKPANKSKVKTPGWAWASVTVIAMRKGSKNAAGVPTPTLDWIMAEPLEGVRRAALPPDVAAWAVEPFAVPGGVMLDPFTGSGALCKAAAAAGMQAIGYELNPPETGLWEDRGGSGGSSAAEHRVERLDSRYGLIEDRSAGVRLPSATATVPGGSGDLS